MGVIAGEEVFDREEIVVPVFQKEPAGNRPVCYCFGVSEDDLRRELVETGRSTPSDRITALVKADRCACEVKNPQGSCCLGNVAAATKAAKAALGSRCPTSGSVPYRPNSLAVGIATTSISEFSPGFRSARLPFERW